MARVGLAGTVAFIHEDEFAAGGSDDGLDFRARQRVHLHRGAQGESRVEAAPEVF